MPHPRKKPSFLDKLTGAVPVDDHYDDTYEYEEPQHRGRYATEGHPMQHHQQSQGVAHEWHGGDDEEDDADGQLAVDVYQTPDEIVVRTIVAGIDPEELDISISRDMVVIKGAREDEAECAEDDFFHKELYWGSFSRSVLLPAEIEVEEAEAHAHQGLLTIHLPKIDKEKQRKIMVKSK
jgi:HSP20 family protein